MTIMMNLANNNNKSKKAKSLRIIKYSDQIKYNNLIISKQLKAFIKRRLGQRARMETTGKFKREKEIDDEFLKKYKKA